MERSPLHICEHQPRLFGHVPPLAPAVVLFLSLACCGEASGERKTERERETKKESVCERGLNTVV